MSKPVNPFTIGAFLVGALLLMLTAILIFGGGQFLKKKNQYVIYFDSALNGLKMGAPVTLQGVQIGTVTEIVLEIDEHASRIIKPVVIEIDQALMLNASGQPLKAVSNSEESRQNTQSLIDAGLKAQLKTQSLLTGLLYVEFNFHRDDPLKLTERRYKNLPELPSVQTTEDQILNTADEIMAKLRKLPLEAMVNDLAASLKAVHDFTNSEDLKQNRIALNKTLGETEKLVANMDRALPPLLNNINSTVTDIHSMVQQFTQDTKPILTSTATTLNSANKLLLDSKHSLTSIETFTAPDAPLWRSLEALHDAAQSTKDLTDYLQQHPESIIYGKE